MYTGAQIIAYLPLSPVVTVQTQQKVKISNADLQDRKHYPPEQLAYHHLPTTFFNNCDYISISVFD